MLDMSVLKQCIDSFWLKKWVKLEEISSAKYGSDFGIF